VRDLSHGLAGALAVAALVAGCSGDDGGAVATTTSATAAVSTTSTSSSAAPARYTADVEPVTAADLPSSWRPGCPVPVEQLRLVRLTYWGFDDAAHEGRIVVNEDAVGAVIVTFHELFDARYPIERMVPVDAYGGSDDASMAANNTSAFNCRPATGGTGWSEHAYGRAVDLNPLQNPYVTRSTVLPPQSARYTDRTSTDKGVIHDGDAAVTAFAQQGWEWGGHWQTLKDYQHFSASGR